MLKKTLTMIIIVTVMGIFTPTTKAHFFKGCKGNFCKRHVVKPFKSKVLAIASCESGRRWYINGLFDGGLQFHPGTWNSTNSKYAFAYQAPPLEQMYRGVVWASMIGWAWRSTAGWPNCG